MVRVVQNCGHPQNRPAGKEWGNDTQKGCCLYTTSHSRQQVSLQVAVIQDDAEALALFREAMVDGPGGSGSNQYEIKGSAINDNIINTTSSQGTSKAYTTAREAEINTRVKLSQRLHLQPQLKPVTPVKWAYLAKP